MMTTAERLAQWAVEYDPTEEDKELANRSLRDTLAVSLAARSHPIRPIVADLPDAARWAVLAHVLSFDDLHLPSTSHISAVCVSAALAVGGDADGYLAAAGVMARVGAALGWGHYSSGWHITCTAGAIAAAAGAARSFGLTVPQTAAAIALAVPGAAGVTGAFGTSGKALQVGFATEAGVRAARLVAAGASTDPRALEQWLHLVGGDPGHLDLGGPAIPGGLAIKHFPCCYSLQRPICALRDLLAARHLDTEIERVEVTTPESSVRPLIYHQPQTGSEGQLSMEYAVAATVLDGSPGFGSFTTAAVQRPAARDLVDRTSVTLLPGGTSLLDGGVRIVVHLHDGCTMSAVLETPPGSPSSPPSKADLYRKYLACGADVPDLVCGIGWSAAACLLRTQAG